MKDSTEKLYEDLFQFVSEKTLTDGHSGLEIAAVLAAQALTIYKTILSESDFNDIMLEIYNSRDRIKKLDIPDITIQ
jgi:hypothetical protein